MGRSRLLLLTVAALLAFAGNSLLCRLALRGGHIDPAAFTTLRIVSGAVALWVLLALRRAGRPAGDWTSALALTVYAVAFSFAYLTLSAGMGALLLFGAVQASMLLAGIAAGERPGPAQLAGLALAVAGLVFLVLPGLEAPAPLGAALVLAAGVAWGMYSLRGRRAGVPVLATAGNFLRAVPLAALAALPFVHSWHADGAGVTYALVSGVVTSGLGYVVWYAALKGLTATRAAVAQLSVPVLAALGGVLLLGEALTPRLAIASCVILGGVALAILGPQPGRYAGRRLPG
ncbi:MAG TPA: DMT family transporter [Gammaproteobacteria bacterium]|jgi:drug/metabolite transporter (DMT)-like permease